MTPNRHLDTLGEALQCQICKDLLDAPVTTQCFHTFCSRCIRSALMETSLCPVCRTSTQTSTLRKCPALGEAAEAFSNFVKWYTEHEHESGQKRETRQDTLARSASDAVSSGRQDRVNGRGRKGQDGLDSSSQKTPDKSAGRGRRGQKRTLSDLSVGKLPSPSSPSQPARTRPRRAAAIAAATAISLSQTASTASFLDEESDSPPGDANDGRMDIDPPAGGGDDDHHGGDEEDEVVESPEKKPPQRQRSAGGRGRPASPVIDDGLVACPICNRRMKEGLVFEHLNTCSISDPSPPGNNTKPSVPASRSRQAKKQLPQLATIAQFNYSILSETALRKKVKELGIPSTGPKQTLIRRHQEWVIIYNANCDSNRPKSKRELLKELDAWEKLHNAAASSSSSCSSSTAVAAIPFGVRTSKQPESGTATGLAQLFSPATTVAMFHHHTAASTSASTGNGTSATASSRSLFSRSNSGVVDTGPSSTNGVDQDVDDAKALEVRQKCEAATVAAQAWESKNKKAFDDLAAKARAGMRAQRMKKESRPAGGGGGGESGKPDVVGVETVPELGSTSILEPTVQSEVISPNKNGMTTTKPSVGLIPLSQESTKPDSSPTKTVGRVRFANHHTNPHSKSIDGNSNASTEPSSNTAPVVDIVNGGGGGGDSVSNPDPRLEDFDFATDTDDEAIASELMNSDALGEIGFGGTPKGSQSVGTGCEPATPCRAGPIGGSMDQPRLSPAGTGVNADAEMDVLYISDSE